MEKVTFRDLSTPLKALVIFGWAYVVIFAVGFTIGFIGALMSSL